MNLNKEITEENVEKFIIEAYKTYDEKNLQYDKIFWQNAIWLLLSKERKRWKTLLAPVFKCYDEDRSMRKAVRKLRKKIEKVV